MQSERLVMQTTRFATTMRANHGPLKEASTVRREGFTVQPRALTARQVAQCHMEAQEASLDDCVQPAPGYFGTLVPAFADPCFGFLHAGAPWMSTVRALLGEDCVLVAGGLLDAKPGSAAGKAHHGGSHLLAQPLPCSAAMAPHCITVFIALADIDGETSGIVVWPRSHHGDGWSPPCAPLQSPPASKVSATNDDASSATNDDASSAASACCHLRAARPCSCAPVLRAGDALICDLRVLRKELANQTITASPIVYLSLAKPWFRGVHQFRTGGEVMSLESARLFARVALAAEHVPVKVGATVRLFLSGASNRVESNEVEATEVRANGVWERAVVVTVWPATEVFAGTPWRRSVRMGRLVMDSTGEVKEGDIDELLVKGHLIVETAKELEEGALSTEQHVGNGGQGAGTWEQEAASTEEHGQQEAAQPEGSSSDLEPSDDESDDDAASEPVTPMRVSRLCRASATEFRAEGFTIAADALTAAELAQMRAACEEARATATEAHRLDLAPGRLDLLMPAFATAPFRFLHAEAPWMDAARSLLGDDCSLFTAGVLFNEPGAGAGNVHLDGDHLFGSPAADTAAPPPHCLTVFIPLIDVDGATNGTALWPRSHHGAGWKPVEAAARGDTPAAGAVADAPPPVARKGEDPLQAIAPALRAGDALLFDFRLLHRALANSTCAVRPVIYLILTRRWFRDCDNWPDVAVALSFDRVCLRPEPEVEPTIPKDPPPLPHLLPDGALTTSLGDELMVACEDCSAAGPGLFEKFGVFAVRDAVSPAKLVELQLAAKANLDDALRYRSQHYAAGTMGSGVWKELCCRDGDRFDVQFRMSEEPFAALGADGSWCEAVRLILGADAQLLYTGQVVACGCDPEPASDDGSEIEDQAWHMDGAHLDDELQLPCHMLTVFVPLVDLGAENGATEFSLGTHLHDCEDSNAMGEHIIECSAGSAILFDYRLLHRGTANRTTADRPILYFTYARSGVEDPVNYRHASQETSILHGLPAGSSVVVF